ncbi:BufA2 family periplasmic bufferin-type metallophore [Desertibaculum subflavum]|uniref:BufA2 family periplasmic bufferin-type metallophore n=1 Tax=Desertibaculum subflavum TaxID=2268458 RepID=UPI000E66EBC4
MTSKTMLVAATAAAFFAAGTIAAVSPARADVKCVGANACKGTSACKTASSACKGRNACKGQGWVSTKDEAACKAAGGKAS